VTWQTIQGPVTVRSWYRVAPDGDGCHVTGGAEGSFRGPLGGLLTRLAVPGMVSQARKDVETLRRYLESAEA
jgi:hypothetical protein